jgi:hypothetical protein
MDTPRYRSILRHQLGWTFAGPVTNSTDRYVDRSGADQFVPNLNTFKNEDEVIEYLVKNGCEVNVLQKLKASN